VYDQDFGCPTEEWLQDYCLQLSDLFGQEWNGLHASIEEHHRNYLAIAVALALFLSGAAALDVAFHNSSLDAVRHPLTHMSESPFYTFVVLLFIGGVWGVSRGCSK
jgi:hypothetical protein